MVKHSDNLYRLAEQHYNDWCWRVFNPQRMTMMNHYLNIMCRMRTRSLIMA